MKLEQRSLRGKTVLIHGEPKKKLYLLPSELIESGFYLFPDSLAHLAPHVACECNIAVYSNMRMAIVEVLNAMRNKADIVLVEPSDVLHELRLRARKVASFLAWYSSKYVRKHGRSVFFVMRDSLGGVPPYYRYFSPWIDVDVRVEFRRGHALALVRDGEEAWEEEF